MARLPFYEQQTLPQGGRADAGMFGAASGQAMAQAGSALQDIGVAMKRREDVIDRTVRLGDMNKFATESLSALETQDLVRKDTIDTYVQGLRAKKDELLAGHAGTAQSKAEFQAQLENQIAQYEQGANAARSKASNVMLGTMIEQRTNELAVDAGFAPDMLGDIFTQLDADIDQFADALPAGLVEQYKNSGRSAIATTAVQRLQSDEQFEAADQLLNDPDVRKFLPPDVSRRLVINNAAGMGKQAAEQRRVESNVSAWRQVLPNMTPQQEAMVRQLPIKRSDMSIAEKIVELEMIQGSAATGDQIQRIMGVGGDSGMFGNSLDGRSLKFVTENADRYRMGIMQPQEALQFQAMYNHLYGPKERLNPITQLMERTRPSVPPQLQQALQEGSSFYGSPPMAGGAAAAPGGMPAPFGQEDMGMDNSFIDPQGRTDFRAPPPQPGEPGFQQSAQASAADSQMMNPSTPTINQAVQSGRTVFQRIGTVTGPLAAGAQAIGGVPGVGEMFGGGGQYTVDRQFVDATSKELIRALSQSGRYLATEMASIEKEVSIAGRALDNDQAYALRIIGIDQALEARVQGELKIMANPNTPMDQRRNAMSVVNTINNFRAVLGAPPTVNTRKELFSYPPGTVVYTPQGFKVVPESEQ
jgi:hypothetical protein